MKASKENMEVSANQLELTSLHNPKKEEAELVLQFTPSDTKFPVAKDK